MIKKFKFLKDNTSELLNDYDGYDFDEVFNEITVRTHNAVHVEDVNVTMELGESDYLLDENKVEEIMKHMVWCYYRNSYHSLHTTWGEINFNGIVSRPNSNHETELFGNVRWDVDGERPIRFPLLIPSNLFNFYGQNI